MVLDPGTARLPAWQGSAVLRLRCLGAPSTVSLTLLCALLGASATSASDLETGRTRQIRATVESSTRLLQRSAQIWTMSHDCASCHHQMLGSLAMTVVGEKGFPVEEAKLAIQRQRLRRHVEKRRLQHLFGTSGSNPAVSQSYALAAMAANKEPATPATDAAVHMLTGRQSHAGSWSSLIHQAPLEDSTFTATALTVRALLAYPLRGRHAELHNRVAKAAAWLERTPPRDTEDRVMQLFGLYWTHRSVEELAPRLEQLAAEQNPDGGWGQVAGRRSDAYATGQVLVALQQVGGYSVSETPFSDGVDYLLKTSHEPASWHVASRALETREDFFETGFPHGRDQFISYAASSWATMALAFAVKPGPTVALAPTVAARSRSTADLPPLIEAALYGDVRDVRDLLAAGEPLDCRGPLGLTATVAAVHDPAKLRLLLAQGADPNAETEIGLRAIHVASFSDPTGEATRALIEHGAKPNARTPTGLTPAYLAAASGHLEALEALYAGGARRQSSSRDLTPLLISLRRGDEPAVRSFLAESPDLTRLRSRNGYSPLALAVLSGSAELVQTLIEHGAQPNQRDVRGRTPLHLAAALGSPEITRRLLAAGADPLLADRAKSTPSDTARASGNEFLVATLERHD